MGIAEAAMLPKRNGIVSCQIELHGTHFPQLLIRPCSQLAAMTEAAVFGFDVEFPDTAPTGEFTPIAFRGVNLIDGKAHRDLVFQYYGNSQNVLRMLVQN